MSNEKYTKEELQSMAQVVIAADARGDDRSMLLVLRLSAETGLPPQECADRISEMAQGVFR